MNSFFYMEEAPKIKTRPTNKARKEEPYVDETWERVAKRILYLCRLKKITLNTLALPFHEQPAMEKLFQTDSQTVTYMSYCGNSRITTCSIQNTF